MKAIKLLGLSMIFASAFSFANETVVSADTATTSSDAPIVFAKEKSIVPIVGGYTLENGILTARTYNCGINLEDLDMEAKVNWNGNTPQLQVVGSYPDFMCRALFTGEFTLDLTQFIENTPPHILDRMEIVTTPGFGLNQ